MWFYQPLSEEPAQALVFSAPALRRHNSPLPGSCEMGRCHSDDLLNQSTTRFSIRRPRQESDMSSGRMLMDGWAGGGRMPFDETASFCNGSAVSPTPLLRSIPVASNQPMSASSVQVPHHASPKAKGISNHSQDSIAYTPSQAPLQVQLRVCRP